MLKPKFIGTKKQFNEYFSAYCRGLVQNLSRKHKLEIARCEHCGIEGVSFDAAHIHGKDRVTIINAILSNYEVDGLVDIELDLFKDLFIDAHHPIASVIYVLCKDCHTKYDSPKKEMPIAEDILDEVLPIGKHVRAVFSELWNKGLIDSNELSKLQNLGYSKLVFNSSFEILKPQSQDRRDESGIPRYYKDQFIPGYWLSAQWYERQRVSFDNWAKTMRNV